MKQKHSKNKDKKKEEKKEPTVFIWINNGEVMPEPTKK